MSKVKDFYTDVFDDIIAADVSYSTANFGPNKSRAIKDSQDLAQTSAYYLMRKAAMNLLKANGLETVFEDYKKSLEET